MKLPRLRRSSWVVLTASLLLHAGLLAGWRWQQPLVPYFFDATVLSGGRGLDFYAVYQAGYNARHGLDIYEGDPARVPIVAPYFTPYRYLPVVAYSVGAGLSLLKPLTAYKLWVVVLEITLLGCVAATFAVTRRQPDLWARLAGMWLAFTPYYLELFMGQFTLVQAALVWGLFVLAWPGRAGLEGENRRRLFDGLWVTSVLWKVTTVLFVPMLARLRRWGALAAGGALAAAVTVPYFWLFPAHWEDFVRNNAGSGVAGHELGNLGWRQLVYESLAAAGAPAGLQQAAQALVVAGVLAAATWITWRSPKLDVTAGLSLWLSVFFLISPQVWEHHYVLLLPALVGLYAQTRSRWVLAVWALLALPTPFGFIGLQPVIAANHDLRAFALEPRWQPLLQHASKALPTLALFAFCARRAWGASERGRAEKQKAPMGAPERAARSEGQHLV